MNRETPFDTEIGPRPNHADDEEILAWMDIINASNGFPTTLLADRLEERNFAPETLEFNREYEAAMTIARRWLGENVLSIVETAS